MNRRDWCAAIGAMVSAPWLTACSSGPPTLTYDVDECAFCRMTISDRRFGAAARTSTGRAERFDSIECLAGWVNAEREAPQALWVTDAMVPGELVPLSTVRFHRLTNGSTPMSGGYLAVTSTRGSTPWDGVRLTWSDIRKEVQQQGTATGHQGDSGGM